ncbi:DNA methyltransferase Dim-2 [Lambiella insularis]|nr:DNA methyltransferase Dim-2 [Lambiella insularis]
MARFTAAAIRPGHQSDDEILDSITLYTGKVEYPHNAPASVRSNPLMTKYSSIASPYVAVQSDDVSSTEDEDKDGEEMDLVEEVSSKNKGTKMLKEIRLPAHIFPQSAYLGYEALYPCENEQDLLTELLSEGSIESNASFGGSSFISFDLENFDIYGDAKRKSGEFVALHDYVSDSTKKMHYFDGIIIDSGARHYVQRIPIKVLSIGGYEDYDMHTVGENIWIQSLCGAKHRQDGVWYRLKTPSKEYDRYHRPFLWLADFAKHVVDFMNHHAKVTLSTFKHEFHAWICGIHAFSVTFEKFLISQATQVNGSYLDHPIWAEIGPESKHLLAIKRHETMEQLTIVTPFAYECFKHMSFSKFLEPQEPLEHLKIVQSETRPDLGCGKIRAGLSGTVEQRKRNFETTADSFRVGDVIELSRDGPHTSKWNDNEQTWAGDTVLVRVTTASQKPILEPMELLSPVRGHQTLFVMARRLPRRRRDFQVSDADANELVYSSIFETISVGAIDRMCHVRFYTVQDKTARAIPAPYCRNGTADAYYIVFESDETRQCLRPITRPHLVSLNQGFDPTSKSSDLKLQAMDLFCGGGNFGRGIEEGGAAEIKWAVDIDMHAAHTYRANLATPGDVEIFLGSVCDYLKLAMAGKFSKLIARPGEVDLIVAGTPCPGFSTANLNRGNDRALRNVSLIVTWVAFIDFYRPQYAILENLRTVAECAEKNKNKNVFSQLLCVLVGMGYQVSVYNLDSWAFGSPQSRSRLFIAIAAPGLPPMPPPQASHSHPPGIKARTLGRAANGLPFGERNLDAICPFEYITIGSATADLPSQFNGRSVYVRYPDHRVTRTEDTNSFLRIESIPRFPRFSGLVAARAAGLLPKSLIETYRLFGRAKKDPDQGQGPGRELAPML